MALRRLRTTCVMDCPDACALEVALDGQRVVAIGGRSDHPDTAGFICSKIARFGSRLDHSERILTPLRRIGPKGEARFEPIAWPAALRWVAGRLAAARQQGGGESILPFHYGGSNGWLTDDLTDTLFFARLGASRLDKTICAAITTAVATALYGKIPGVSFGDYAQARAILLWGANPRTSNIHLVPYLRRAKERGAFIATIDPRRTLGDADLHLPVLPGADLPVALAMIRRFAEQGRLDHAFLARCATGAEALLEAAGAWPLARAAEVAAVPASDIARLADAYAEAAPAVIRCGWGLERNANGAPAVAAILAMPALLGKFGVAGGGYTLSNSGAYQTDRSPVLGPIAWNTRAVNMSQLARALASGPGGPEPPVRVLFVYNANPAVTVPDQAGVLRGLARDDLFTVVHEQVMTDTARFADVVLPATTFLEHHDLRGGYGSYAVGGCLPVVAPRGEAWSNHRLFSALARELGFSDEPFGWSDEELLRRVAAATRMAGRALDVERLAAGGTDAPDFPGPGPIQFGSVYPRTADGLIHLAPAILGRPPYRLRANPAAGPGRPLALVSPASSRLISSTLGEFNLPVLEVSIHPADAAARGIAEGDAVRLAGPTAEVRCRARLTAQVRPGVVSLPKGAWRRASDNGATATALCPDHVNDVAGGACFNDARVEVERVPEQRPAGATGG